MRKYTKTVGALAAASALVAGYASAEIEGEVHVGYATNYEFRFVDLGDDLVEAGVDLSYALNEDWSIKGGAWYGSVNDDVALDNELDLYGAVATSLGPVNLEFGYIFYTYPGSDFHDTQEVYASAFVDIFAGISAGAAYYYDFDNLNGWYLQPELRWSHDFNECLKLNLSTGVGIADGLGSQVSSDAFYIGDTHDGFQGWFVKAELPWEFRDGVTLTPYLKYTDADSGLAGDSNTFEGGQEHIVAGVKLAVGF
jgi:uncharacterized protein (TIGR02001 family)